MEYTATIAFADDHPVLLSGLIGLFGEMDCFDIVGNTGTADGALAIALAKKPDVMVMDLSMPGDAFRCIASIATRVPDTKVVVFTAYSSVDAALKAVDAGATGFVLKGNPVTELIDCIDAVVAGQMYITPQLSAQVLNGLRESVRRKAREAQVRLTVREKQIVGLLLQARTNREIADQIGITERTVKHYMTGLMMKLKARNRVEVVLAAKAHSAPEGMRT